MLPHDPMLPQRERDAVVSKDSQQFPFTWWNVNIPDPLSDAIPVAGRRLFVTWRVGRHSLRRNVAISIWTDSNGVIFVTDSRSYLTRFARTATVQPRKIRPSSAGDFRDLRSYQCSPRFHTSLGATFLWKTGVLSITLGSSNTKDGW